MTKKYNKDLENRVEVLFKNIGFCAVKYKEYIQNKALYGDELLIKNVPYCGLYDGVRNRGEFLLQSKKYNINSRIECKSQQYGGSVDEKLPYALINLKYFVNEKHNYLVLDGDGFKDGAKKFVNDNKKIDKIFKKSKNEVTVFINFIDFEDYVKNLCK